MKKIPPLSIVDPSSPNPLAPPASLAAAGVQLWQDLHRDFVLDDSGTHQMLLRICEAADSLASYDEQVERDGPTIRTKTGMREHPLLKHQLATRSFIVRSLHRLGLDIEPTRSVVGRPPGVFKNKVR